MTKEETRERLEEAIAALDGLFADPFCRKYLESLQERLISGRKYFNSACAAELTTKKG